jgi:iron complex transport system substrate-binding protein
VHARDPAVIVGAGSAATEGAFRAEWQPRTGLTAVRGGFLAFVPGDLIQRPTLRLAEGVALLCKGLDGAREQALRAR